MKSKIIYLIIYIGITLAFSACSDNIDFPDEPDTYENIAIVYWMGDNSLSGAAVRDIKELVQGKDKIPTNSKIIIYADTASAFPVIYQLDAKNGLKVWKKYTKEEDCTDSLTLLNNLKTIVKNFPAKNYGLTFGAHGTGWSWRQRRALGPDDNDRSADKWLNVPTLRGVLQELPHFKYIFFDVCFMQSIEVAYELRNVTDWVVGSPAEIPSPGAPYNLITDALCKGDAYGIVEGYDSYYPNNRYKGVVLSAVNCNELENFTAATSTYIKTFFADRHTVSGTVAQNIQKYSSEFSSFTYCYDMNSIMPYILSDEEYQQWVEAFDKAVPLRKASSGEWTTSGHCNNPYIYDSEHFGGISMYIPQEGADGNAKNNELKHYQWYKDAGWNETGW